MSTTETQSLGRAFPFSEHDDQAYYAVRFLQRLVAWHEQYALETGRDACMDVAIMRHGSAGTYAERLKRTGAFCAGEYARIGADLDEWDEAIAAAMSLAVERHGD